MEKEERTDRGFPLVRSSFLRNLSGKQFPKAPALGLGHLLAQNSGQRGGLVNDLSGGKDRAGAEGGASSQKYRLRPLLRLIAVGSPAETVIGEVDGAEERLRPAVAEGRCSRPTPP